MLNRFPLVSRFILFIVLPLALLFWLLGRYLDTSLPRAQGSQTIPGISQQVKLSRDENGVVYIDAKTDRDAFFAMGFAHAQDRMWQLELQRRIASGRISEIFGLQAVEKDIWMRTLNLYGAAQKAWDSLDPATKDALTAYADGINHWIDAGHSLPPEFDVLDIKPKKWTTVDSLAWSKVFALNISSNYQHEIVNLVASKNLNPAQMLALLGKYPENAPETISNVELETQKSLTSLLELQSQIEDELRIGGEFAGSNGWVVSGDLTKEGGAILANDPHLGLQIPSLWYAASLKGDKLDVYGMTLVGLPVVVFGRNNHIAWGGTAMLADVQDLVIEQLNPKNPNQYKHNGQWLEITSKTELIGVRSEFPSQLRGEVKPLKIEVRSTVNGPLVTDLNPSLTQPVSMRWTALDDKDQTVTSFLKLNYARDWSEFTDALSYLAAPALNVLYTDKNNNIGYFGAGHIPIRNKGEGQYPVPGWDESYRWNGYIPADELPRSYNPAKGYIVTANNKVVGSDYPYYIASDWAPPARAERIEQMIVDKINSGEKLDVQYMRQMQGDTIDVSVSALLEHFKALKPYDERQGQAQQYLNDWNGDMDKTSVAASVFYVWARHLRGYLFDDDMEGFFNRGAEEAILSGITGNVSYDGLADALSDTSINWCDKINTDRAETCERMLHLSLESAILEMDALLGSDMDDWQWGNMHETTYLHTPLSNIKFLKPLVGREIASGGSANTVNVANARYIDTEGYDQTFGAGFRQILQWRPQGIEHLYMNSTGQSGHPYSRHFSDMVEPFNQVEFYDFQNSSTLKTGDVLTLSPQ